jgi:AbiV family abortive infection protein
MTLDEIDLALLPVAKNAIRLFDDAELLFKNGRYPTAVAVAIASIEAAGNFVIRSREASHGQAPSSKPPKHHAKHYELGWFYWKWATWQVLRDTFEDFKSWVQKRPEHSGFYEQIKDLDHGEAVDFLQAYMFKSEEELHAYLKERFPHPKYLGVRGMAQSQRIEETRRTGLYCDVDLNYKVTRNPESLTKADAEEWLNHASFAISHMKTWHDILTKKAQPAPGLVRSKAAADGGL